MPNLFASKQMLLSLAKERLGRSALRLDFPLLLAYIGDALLMQVHSIKLLLFFYIINYFLARYSGETQYHDHHG